MTRKSPDREASAAPEPGDIPRTLAPPEDPVPRTLAPPEEPIPRTQAPPEEPIPRTQASPAEPIPRTQAPPAEPIPRTQAPPEEPIPRTVAPSDDEGEESGITWTPDPAGEIPRTLPRHDPATPPTMISSGAATLVSGPDAGDSPDGIDFVPASPVDAAAWASFPEGIRNRYRLEGTIGRGGMGVVYEARDVTLDRRVAVKGMNPPQGMDPSRFRPYLEREIKFMARLSHPNILPVFDMWLDDRGNPWCSMLRVAGDAPSLATLLGKLDQTLDFSRRPTAQLIQIFLQVCRGVAHAHKEGILHRDLKPDNVLLGPAGEALVGDWGLAAELSQVWPRAPDAAGTPEYAAPEQMGRLGPPRADRRSDVYSLGLILYEMLVGKRTETQTELWSRHASPARGAVGPAQPGSPAAVLKPLEIPRRIPRDLAAILHKATAIEPQGRYADVPSMMAEIDRHLEGGFLEGVTYEWYEEIPKLFKRYPGAFGLGLALVITLLVGGLAKWTVAVVERRTREAKANEKLANIYLDEAKAQVRDLQLAASRQGLPLRALQTMRLAESRPADAVAELLECVMQAPGPGEAPPGPELMGTCLDLLGHARLARVVAPEPGGAGERNPEGWAPAMSMSRDGTVALRRESGKVELLSWPEMKRIVVIPAQRLLVHAISSDGRIIAAGDEDRLVRLWDATGKQDGEPIPGHRSRITALAIDGHGALVASGAEDGRLQLASRAAPPGATGLLEAHRGPITALCFSPDGGILASASADATIRLWRSDGTPLGEPMAAHGAAVTCITFSSKGDLLSSGSADRTIAFWDLTGKPVAAPMKANHAIEALAFDGGDTRLAYAESHRIHIVDIQRHVPLVTFTDNHLKVRAIRFAPGGRALLAKSDASHRLHVFDLNPREAGPPLEGHDGEVTALATTPEGWLVSGSSDGRVRLWTSPDRPAALLPAPPELSDPVTALATSLDGITIAAGTRAGWVHRWKRRAERSAVHFELAASTQVPAPGDEKASQDRTIGALALDRDASRILTGTQGGETRLWNDTMNSSLVVTTDHPRGVLGAAFTPNGERILVVGRSRDKLYPPGESTPGMDPGVLALYSKELNKEMEAQAIHTGDLLAVAIRPDGKAAVTSGSDFDLQLYDLERDSTLRALRGHPAPVGAVAYSPDGTRIASGSADGSVRLWTSSGEPLGQAIHAHDTEVTGVTFSSDGRWIATGSRDGTLRRWHADPDLALSLLVTRLKENEPVHHPSDPGHSRIPRVLAGMETYLGRQKR